MIKVISFHNYFDYQKIKYYLFFAFLGAATYGGALFYFPFNPDDLIILSSIINESSPLNFFWKDWGLNNNPLYRPLHSITIWLSYIIFDWSFWSFNQLVNIFLHIVIMSLLFNLLKGFQTDKTFLFLIICAFLITPITILPVTWISNRHTLFVAIFLILLLKYFIHSKSYYLDGRILFFFIILSLLSQESGLILPIFVLFYTIMIENRFYNKKKIIWSMVFIIVAYMIFRFVIFGSNFVQYSESGFLFGYIKYNSLADIEYPLRYYGYIENIFKNIIAVFLPIFNNDGGLFIYNVNGEIKNIFNICLTIITTTITLIIFFKTKIMHISKLRKIVIIIIFINAILHFPISNHRILYIPQICLCLFLCASQFNPKDISLIKFLAITMLFINVFKIQYSIDRSALYRHNQISIYNLQDLQDNIHRIDPNLIHQINMRYKYQ